MISIARLLLFFVITMGYNAFFRNTVKMNRSLTWVFTFSVITLVLYLGSLLGFMLQTVYAISVLGCLLSLYYLWAVWKKKYRFRRLDYIALGMMAYLLLFGITLWHSPLLHYDNFTHWATIVKFFHINNALPTQQDTIISYYTYPVGSSLFIYFFTTIVGFSEGSMLVGQFFLIASSLYAMFAARLKFNGVVSIVAGKCSGGQPEVDALVNRKVCFGVKTVFLKDILKYHLGHAACLPYHDEHFFHTLLCSVHAAGRTILP